MKRTTKGQQSGQLLEEATVERHRAAVLDALGNAAMEMFIALMGDHPKYIIASADDTTLELAKVEVVEDVAHELWIRAAEARSRAQALLRTETKESPSPTVKAGQAGPADRAVPNTAKLSTKETGNEA